MKMIPRDLQNLFAPSLKAIQAMLGRGHVFGVSELVLDLEKGPNVLKVSTGLPCQGIYEETLVVAPEPILFPNPTRNNVSIYYDHANQPLGIRVFAANGQLVREESQTGEKVQTEISLSGLPQGIYYVEISGNGFKKTQKVIKQ